MPNHMIITCAILMIEMEYTKPSLDINQQVNLLLSRGMQGDPVYMASKLTLVSYYRLSAYWRIYRNPDDTFHSSPDFEHIWHLYVFDHKLRLIVMDAIERIEIAVRSRLAYHHSQAYGAFGYADDPINSMSAMVKHYPSLLIDISNQVEASKSESIRHFKHQYGEKHNYPPIWMTVEVVSFGTLIYWYRSLPNKIKQQIAKEYGVEARVFGSWLNMLRPVRNTCAHHARLWNTGLLSQPVPTDITNTPTWPLLIPTRPGRLYTALVICKWCINKISPSSRWHTRLFDLCDEFPDVPIDNIGIPTDWRTHPFWST